MKAIEINSPVSRVVNYHGIEVPLALGERFIAADRSGDLWAYVSKPILRTADVDVGEWGIERGHTLPRAIGRVDLQGVNWKDSIECFGDDPKVALPSR